jgi:hypothetical protein
MDDRQSVRPGEADLLQELIIHDEIRDIADRYNLDLVRDMGECNTCFAKRVIEALADKFIDIDIAIQRIETLVPDAALED